jgi:tetratricopeptide (TPR) repeat protein
VVAAVSGRADGNPLFIEQLVGSLLDERIVRQDGDHWRATDRLAGTAIPATIQGLLLARIDRLEPETRAAVHVGAVIGRRFSGSLLARVGAAVHLRLPADLASLEASGLVAAPADGSDEFAFRHALIQEAAYASLLHVDRARLHRAVAHAISALQSERLDELAPVLAFHHRRAGDFGPAIRFTLLAGWRALVAHANAEALAAFDDVLAMVGELPERSHRARRAAEGQAHEGRGDVLGWLHRRDEALAAYEAAEAGLPPGASLDRARLARKRAGLLTSGQRVTEALAAFASAERILGSPAAGDDAARVEWVELHLARAGLHYFLGDLASLEGDLAMVGPWIEAAGSPDQQLGYLSQLISSAFRRCRYRVDDETIALERRALELARRPGDPSAAAVREFGLGLALLLRDELAEVEEHFERALAVAKACEDELLVARILTYGPMLARKRGDAEGCRAAAAVALEAAEHLQLPEYVAMGTASRAWIAWRDGDPTAARAAAAAATRAWDDGAFRYPFRWVALLPVLALDVEAGNLEAAVAAAGEILDPAQQRLPEPLELALAASVAARDRGDSRGVRSALSRSVEAARSLGYL